MSPKRKLATRKDGKDEQGLRDARCACINAAESEQGVIRAMTKKTMA